MGISREPRRGRSGPRARIAVVEVLEKRLGSLPVIADFSRRLDIAGIIDRACPMRDLALVSHGQVIEALIANRLTPSAGDGRCRGLGAGLGGGGGVRAAG